MAGSPAILGSSEPAGQSITICGSDSKRALARSISSRSLAFWSRAQASTRAARPRARTSMIAVTTANKTTPIVSARKAISCWAIPRCASSISSCSARAGCSTAPAGDDAIAPIAPTNRPITRRRRCAQRQARPDPVRHAPLPLPASTAIPPASPPRASPRIVQLYSQGESRRKSPDRERGLEGGWTGLWAATDDLSAAPRRCAVRAVAH